MADDTPPNKRKNIRRVEDDYITENTRSRWEGLNTVLAIIILSSLVGIVAFIIVTGATVSNLGQSWFILYSIVVMMAATWAFGKETLEAVKQAKGEQ